MNAFLNALGVVCALGHGHTQVRERLLAGSTDGMRATSGWLESPLHVGAVEETLAPLPAEFADQCSRNNRLLLAAARQIEPELRAAIARHGAHRIGVVLGTSTSGILETEVAMREQQRLGQLPATYDYRRQVPSAPARFLSDWLGTSGPAYVISTACTSSAKALASARRLLDMDVCDAVVCGGVDTLCGLTTHGFGSLSALSAGRSNPFSAQRDGINLGEAAALFLMGRTPSAVGLAGVGASSDAYHMSSPDPTGLGAQRAMRQALSDAELNAADIHYLNLHGTGTPHNDAMESRAVAELLGSDLPCSSTKPMTGHTLGAAGALEAALCWLVLTGNPEQRLPPHIWNGQVDTTMPALRLVHADDRLPSGVARVMSNSFAFGGNNVSLILERCP